MKYNLIFLGSKTAEVKFPIKVFYMCKRVAKERKGGGEDSSPY